MKIPANWYDQLESELKLPYIQELKDFLSQEKTSGYTVYPPDIQVFSSLASTPFAKVKVVIVGQDPYHGEGQAHGLSFSVPPGVRPPPSLKNIFSELSSDLNLPRPSHGCLISWARQGVLLLNATLTVRAGEPKSHYGKGWERLTDAMIEKLLNRQTPLALLLWGNSAKEKCARLLQEDHPHLVLTAPHPSPFSAHTGFLGCRHFSKVNEWLVSQGQPPIDWSIQG